MNSFHQAFLDSIKTSGDVLPKISYMFSLNEVRGEWNLFIARGQ